MKQNPAYRWAFKWYIYFSEQNKERSEKVNIPLFVGAIAKRYSIGVEVLLFSRLDLEAIYLPF